MSYCINPNCLQRERLDTEESCQACGTKLLINDCYRLIKPLRKLEYKHYTEIFEVEDVKDRGTSKVIKILQADEESQKLVDLFEQEVQILINLNHPGIPKAKLDAYFKFTLSNAQRLRCLVMEKIEGDNLEDWVKEKGVISEERAIDWLRQITEILDLVHQNQLFHRDIKPSNIMIRPNGQLVLIDFGTARQITQTVIIGQKVTNVYSHGYTAPEQINGGAVPQSDFFALARTFVYLLIGRHPYDLSERENGKLIWRENATQISQELADLIDNLMAHQPKDRPQDGRQILQNLEKITRKIKVVNSRNLNFRNEWLLAAGLITFGSVIGSIVGVFINKAIDHADNNQSLEAIGNYVTVNANAGFQTRIRVRKGQKVILEPEGHIHIASEQLKNFGDSIRPLIVRGLPNEKWPPDIIKYGLYKFDKNKEFIRSWIAPGGESFQSKMLQECRLRLDQPWGILMAIVIPSQKISDLSDPFEVLGSNGLKPNQLIPVPDKKEILVQQDGWLTFIVNEAVISKHSLSSETSKKYFRAIEQSVQKEGLVANSSHSVDFGSVPLVFFYDNVGAFRVHVTVTN